MGTEITRDRQRILDQLADNWSSANIRDLGATLLRLADSLDQQWDGSNSRAMFRWPNELARIERNAVNLALKARTIYDQRMKRRQFIAPDLLAEPSWDMLLELFMQFAGGAKVSTTSLCIASHAPVSTALRYISQLEEAGMVEKVASEADKRVTFVRLTDKGVLCVGRYLQQV